MKKVRTLNGYRVIYRPKHFATMTSTNWEGWVYEHRYVMERKLGRILETHEVVHHLDCNRANNAPTNLIVIDDNTHRKLHSWLDKGAFIHKSYVPRDTKPVRNIPKYCSVCSITLEVHQHDTCSDKCRGKSQRLVSRPAKKKLRELIGKMSWLAIGRKYGVSDNAIRKWARSYGLL